MTVPQLTFCSCLHTPNDGTTANVLLEFTESTTAVFVTYVLVTEDFQWW